MTNTAKFRRALDRPDFERMNLPQEYWTAKVQGVSEKVAPRVVRYLRQIDTLIPKGVGLVLSGAAGVGKTAITALVCKEARSAGFTVYFSSVWELRELIRNKISFDDDTTLIRRCQEVDVLVLDGLRADDAGDKFFGAKEIEELVAFRARSNRATFITTRLTLAEVNKVTELRNMWEAAKGSTVWLTVEGPNKRDKQQDELKQLALGVES